MTKKNQICHHQIRFFKLKMHQNPFSLGAYDAPPDPLLGWGGGYPLPIPLPARRLRRIELGAYGASVLRPPQLTQNPGASALAAWGPVSRSEMITSW